jgi:1-acyl-sn-glycerol-3-phosphate acyltransferase
MTVAEPAPPSETKKRLFYGLTPASWAIYRTTWWIWWAFERVAFRTRVKGLDRIDPDGPLLLLSNHASMFDPFWVALHLFRPSRFMAASSLLRMPVVGPYLKALGSFPKMKYVKDRESMRTLAEHYENGHVVTLFPEGVRSWTGRQVEVQPGIGRLIKRLDARVLFGRIRSGYIAHPRWATYPRWVPIDIDYFGPVRYPDHLSAEEITEDVRKHIEVEPTRDRSRRSFGFRLAEGLPTLLWACPRCFAPDSLKVPRRDRDSIGCTACGAQWRLDIDTVLHGLDGAPTLTVAEAHDAIYHHFGRPPILDRAAWESDGLIAAHPEVHLHRHPLRGRPHRFATGELRVDRDGVHLHHAGGPWRAPFDELLSVSTEVAGKLYLRKQGDTDRGDLYRLEVPDQSSYKWGTLLTAWLDHHRTVQSG